MEINEYRVDSMLGVATKIQPHVMLFTCPICEHKHERETNFVSWENRLCDQHLDLYNARKYSLSILPEYMKPPIGTPEHDRMFDHEYWLKKRG